MPPLLAAGLTFLLAVVPAAAQTPLESSAAAEKAGDFPRAAALLEPWVAERPDDLDAGARLAKLYAWSGRHADAEARYRRILAKSPDHTDAETGLAYVLAWTGRHTEALALFDRTLARLPGHADALTGAARAEIWRGRPNRARPYLRRLLAVAPNDEFARRELARPQTAAPKVEAAYASERYSRAGPGYAWRADAVLPAAKSWSALAGVERVRRFRNTDDSGSFGAAWKGEGKGGSLRLSLSPDAAVVPRWALEGAWEHSLARGLYAALTLRASEYAPAHTYGQNAGLYWWPTTFSEFGARLSATTTQFRGGPALTRWGYLLTSNLYAREESLRLTPSFGRYEEPFEAGAGAIRSFAASVYHLGLGVKPAPGWELKLDGEYEDRSDGSFVRRGGLGLAYQF